MTLQPVSLALVGLIGIRPLQRIRLSYLISSTSKSPSILSVRDTIPSTSSLTVRLSRLSLLATPSFMTNSVDWICLSWDLSLLAAPSLYGSVALNPRRTCGVTVSPSSRESCSD